MKAAIISDIHGNYEAFQEVLADIDKSNIDRIISLGDNIGYGPEPDKVVQMILARGIPSVKGNHELAIEDEEYLAWFNPVARKSLPKTRELLSQSSIDYVSNLEPFLAADGCRYVHGFPPDSPLIYMFQPSESRKKQVLEKMPERLCFIGHTHTLEMIGYDGQNMEYGNLSQGVIDLESDKKYIVNIGSVGQPRDDGNEAKYVIWDSLTDTIEVKYIPYDIVAVVQKIKEAGLPDAHAERLW